MVQFNLLPDIKMQYLKAKRQKHLVVLASTVAGIAAIAILLILITTVHFIQKKNISDLTKDIKIASDELESTKDLTKILTVQNQLKALEGLHDQKPAASRLFAYLSQVTPNQANIAKLTVDYTLNTMSISGAADKLNTVNTFTDTLKFTKYTVGEGEASSSKTAFSEVVLSAFNRDAKVATYTITLKFDPTIFNQTNEVKLTVPQITTTRSQVEQPTTLFQKSITGNQ